jgi:serine phosphatase RsbU (regulator of sigma subunit)
MHFRNKILTYTFISGLFFMLSSVPVFALQKSRTADTSLIKHYLAKADRFASLNADSSLHYESIAEALAINAGNQDLAAQAFFSRARLYYFQSDYEKSRIYQQKAMGLAQKVNNKTLIGKIYNLYGAALYNASRYEEALEQYNNRLQISIEQKDTANILQAYYNMSLIYSVRGNFKEAVEINYKALDIAEQTQDSLNMMAQYEGLGMCYHQLQDSAKTIYFLNKAYQISVLKKQDYEQAGILIDIGNFYQMINHHPEAIEYYKRAITISKKTGDKRRLATAMANQGKSFLVMQNYGKTIELCEEAIAIQKEIGYTRGLAEAYSNMAEAYYGTGDLVTSKRYAVESSAIFSSMKAGKELSGIYKMLNKIYYELGDKKEALHYLKKHIELRDSIDEAGGVRTISKIELDHEKEKIDQKREFEERVASQVLKQERQVRNIILVVLFLTLALFFFNLRNYIQKQKANKKVVAQKKIIEEKNKAILESISYSKRIQSAILTPQKEIEKLLKESFVLYLPKDIVSGDFYFIEPIPVARQGNWTAVALADCTGHGVPGALMSIMGYNMLKRSLKNHDVQSPGAALDHLNKELHSFLRQNQKQRHVRDGMDIAFCAINRDDNSLMFSGANNPLWILSRSFDHQKIKPERVSLIDQKDGLFFYEIKANKQHVGFNENPETFLTQSFQLSEGDMVYLFTDGYADQFGGPKGKKLKYKKLHETILNNCRADLQIQKKELLRVFEEWRGMQEQVDDVTIIGFKI